MKRGLFTRHEVLYTIIECFFWRSRYLQLFAIENSICNSTRCKYVHGCFQLSFQFRQWPVALIHPYIFHYFFIANQIQLFRTALHYRFSLIRTLRMIRKHSFHY